MIFSFLKNLFNRQNGLALVLSVVILANLLVIAFVVADVILRVGRSAKQISEAEVAYFAAESAMEQAIYAIESNLDASAVGTLTTPASGSLSVTGALWQTYLEKIVSLPVTCIDDQGKFSYPSDPALEPTKNCLYAEDLSQNPLKKNNRLQVRLQPGKSFEINFNISVPDTSFYPSVFRVDWAGSPAGSIVVLDSSGQTIYDTSAVNSTGKIPSSGSMGAAPNYRLRIINQSAAPVVYEVYPHTGSDELTIGLSVLATGSYGQVAKERIVAVERKNWSVY